jgi:arabinofuranan 3-O-arabinosyltransferase
MTTLLAATAARPEQSALADMLSKVWFVALGIHVCFFPVAYFAGLWIYDPNGLFIPTDFVNVWAAGHLVLDGHPALAYDWDIQRQVEVAVLGQDFIGTFAWHYPPPFLFVATLLAQLSYPTAFLCWMVISLLLYVAVMRAIVGGTLGVKLALALPMVFANMLVGQNGFFTAALIGGTLYLMPTRPVLAGICLGLLSYKPQYGLLFPLVLIAAGQWRVFFSAGITAIVLVFVSWLAFGIESWQAFFHWLPMASQAFLTDGRAPWWRLQSIFALVRHLGGTEALAWAFQWILTASVATVLVLMWRSRVPYTVKAAALAAGTLLTTPYLYMYDMMVLAIPIAFLVRIGLKSGFRAYELPSLGCAIALILTYIVTGIPVGLGATLIVAGLVLRRAGPWWRERTPSTEMWAPSGGLAG